MAMRRSSLTSKVIEKELEEDSRLFFQMSLADDKKMTLAQFKESVTEEELLLWQAFHSIKAKRQKQEINKIKRMR
jgi:hypothetical protein